jgi:hypothetical protein
MARTHLLRSITQLAHLLLIPPEFPVKLLNFDLDGAGPSIGLSSCSKSLKQSMRIDSKRTHLRDDILQCRLWLLARRCAEYPVHCAGAVARAQLRWVISSPTEAALRRCQKATIESTVTGSEA